MPDIVSIWDAMIAELEAKKAEIDDVLQGLKRLRESVGGSAAAPGTASFGNSSVAVDLATIPSDAFFKMTIADAAVKFLTIWGNRKPQSTNTIIDALERGGFEKKAYQTVYGILNRRAGKEKDVVNVKGDWGLAEWYGGGAKTTKRRISVPKSSLTQPPERTETEDSDETKQTQQPAVTTQ